MSTSAFHYQLPAAQIAQAPLTDPLAARLLVLAATSDRQRHIADLPTLLQSGDLLVLNDTRVIKARLPAVKDSGGQAEVLLERIEGNDRCLAQVRVSKPLQPGRLLHCGGGTLRVLGREGVFYRLALAAHDQQAPGFDLLMLFEQYGAVPLPPYIERPPDRADERRYQTVYATNPGAVAAPTAGLHLTAELLEQIRARGIDVATVTLHVGAGTFSPIRGDPAAHRMHSERFAVSRAAADAIAACRSRGGRVVAVGTTVVRTLETLAASHNGEVCAEQGETRLFIRPGFRFQVVDALLTNFHLPDSTLLMLVCAFAGTGSVMNAYRAAVARGYRFFSYGDAMLLQRLANGRQDSCSN